MTMITWSLDMTSAFFLIYEEAKKSEEKISCKFLEKNMIKMVRDNE